MSAAPAIDVEESAGEIGLVERRQQDLLEGRSATLSFKKVNYIVDVKAPAPLQNGETKARMVTAQRFLLKDISGIVEPGELLCVMGPTGSGKTTMLDTLAGKVAADEKHLYGDILINGKARDATFKRIAAFVTQFEALTSTLTVEETLYYSAQMNLHKNISAEEKHRRVEKVLDQLGLQGVRKDKIGGALVAGISGGQKKRASIGCELITAPLLMFLDEPTTGLDSASALTVMNRISAMAKAGQTVICTIHQPSPEIFSRFDKLCLLSRGQVMYFGPAQSAIAFFSSVDYPVPNNTNPADHFLDILNTDFAGAADLKAIGAAFNSSQYKQEIDQRQEQSDQWFSENRARVDQNKKQVFESAWGTQFWFLLRRNLLNYIRNPAVFWARLVLYLGLGLFMGTLYLNLEKTTSTIQDRSSILFFVAAFMTFMAIAALPSFIEEREVFVKERQNGAYRVSAFHLANSIASVPFTFAMTMAAACTLYFLIGLKTGAGPFWIFVVLLFWCLYTAESIVVTVSATFPQFMVGLAAAAGIFGFFMLQCGFFVFKSNIPNYWIWGYYISFHSYGLRSFLYNEFADQDFQVTGQPAGTTISGNAILRRFDITENTIALDIGVLIIMAVGYRVLFYLALRFLQKGKR